ncbi:MAG: hypothetical protein IPP80_13265 [Ignavibacteria bacterium]|nr:hypothetical protein [Ignavibacteria bacterium]
MRHKQMYGPSAKTPSTWFPGAEIASSITAECFQHLDAPVIRLAPPDIPIPYNKGMMDAVIPTVERVATELRELLAF